MRSAWGTIRDRFGIGRGPPSSSSSPDAASATASDPRTQLLFFRPDVTDQTVLIDEMAKIFEGKAAPPPGMFFVLTAQEYVHA